MTCKEFDHEFNGVFNYPENGTDFECQKCDTVFSIRQMRHSQYYCSKCGKKLHPMWREYFCSLECSILSIGSENISQIKWKPEFIS